MSTLPDGLISFGPLANCTLALCPVEWSVFQYRPSLAANAIFIAIFGVLLVAHLVQGVWYKTWSYMGCICAGCILQIIGYGGRIMLHDNPFDFNAFLMQISEFGLTSKESAWSRRLTSCSLHYNCPRLLLRCHIRSIIPSVRCHAPYEFHKANLIKDHRIRCLDISFQP